MNALAAQQESLSVATTESPSCSIEIDAAHADGLERLAADDLRDLMRSFMQTARRLETTHATLHAQVARLQHELTEANAALRRSQALAALGEMAAGIAHEVRNPLASIQLYVQMLADDVADRAPQAELCAKIDRAVVGLDAIVRDVLSFARDTKINPEIIGAGELLRRATAACESLINSAGVSIISTAPSDLMVSADITLLTQALGNIVRNAIEAMIESDSPRRELRFAASKRTVRCPDGAHALRTILTARDTGPGIQAHVMDRIFNPFFTTRKAGTGLGLAIVHRIMEAHGGHINIRNNKPPARGASVELCLPSIAS